jgi:hypothetical protein
MFKPGSSKDETKSYVAIEEREKEEGNNPESINRIYYLLTHCMGAKEGPIITSGDTALDKTTVQQQQLGINLLPREG